MTTKLTSKVEKCTDPVAQTASSCSKPGLYYSTLCFQSLKLIGLCRLQGLELDLHEVALGDRAALSWSTYRTTPILVDGEHMIEDWRAIVRYLTEFKDQMLLDGLNPQEQASFFNTVERLDVACFPLLTAPLFLDDNLAVHSIEHQVKLRGLHKLKAFMFRIRWPRFSGKFLSIPAHESPENIFVRGIDELQETLPEGSEQKRKFGRLIDAMISRVTSALEGSDLYTTNRSQ